ncbi:MAG: tetratricopeptide repeat protein [Candidatus Eremiobacterota bacterium]
MLKNRKGEEIIVENDGGGIAVHLPEKKGFTLACEEIEKLVKLINSHNPLMISTKPLYEYGTFVLAPKGKDLEFKPQWWAVENSKKEGIENVLISDKGEFCKVLERLKGFALYDLGKLKECLIAFDKILKEEPDNPDMLKQKGFALYKLKRYDEAKTCLDRIVEIAPEKVNVEMKRIQTEIKEKIESQS